MKEQQTVSGTWIRCPNPSCDYIWSYAGRFFLYATCPSCRRNVKIADNRIEASQPVKVDRLSQIAMISNTSTPLGADAVRQ